MTWGDLDSAERKLNVMTIQGTAIKTGILLAICSAFAVGAYGMVQGNPGLSMPIMLIGLLGGLVLALVIMFSPRRAPFLAPIYAALEGSLLGAFSLAVASMVSARTNGQIGTEIIFQAVLLTFGVLLTMLIGYASGVLRLGGLAKKMVIGATGAIFLVYMASMLLSFIPGVSIAFIHSSGPMGIGFSIFVIVIAAFNLSLDFELIDTGAKNEAPRYMEWYGGFALLVTLVWLYIEILRLLSKLASRR